MRSDATVTRAAQRRRVTRGNGLLEPLLARLRARMADRLIPPHLRAGRLLDVGCGSFPHFLLTTPFAAKWGLDAIIEPEDFAAAGVTIVRHELTADAPLPFASDFFDVVSLLAVFEHIPRAALDATLRDLHRVLKAGGVLVLTTPAGWADPILRTLARTGLVSREEIDEHQDRYDLQDVRHALLQAGFADAAIRTGTFELGLNLWARAVKSPQSE